MTQVFDAPEIEIDDADTTLTFGLTPTQEAFVRAGDSLVANWGKPGALDAVYPVLIGAEGEGKTHAAIAAIFAHAELCKPYLIVPSTGQPRPMMGAIIRDTLVNIKRHTIRSIERVCGQAIEIREVKGILCLIGPGFIVDLLGMDSTDSSAKIQGGEYDFIWLEEPAPILHTGNGGIAVDVWTQLQRRIRGGGTPKRLQVTMNPAATDHWTHREFIEFPVPELKVFRIRKGENPYLSDADRARRAQAFIHRPDLAKRYDEGDFGNVYPGVAITPEFSEQFHVYQPTTAQPYLLPLPNLEIIRFWDGGLNPSVVLLQPTPHGRLHFLDCIIGENMGMRQMIRTRLKFLLARPRYERCFKWRDIGDPAINSRDQSDSDHRGSLVIQQELSQPGRHVFFEPGVSDWDTRREGLKEMFSRMVDGRPMVVVNNRPTEGEPCNRLIALFSGGYQYKVNPAGQVIRDGPHKNTYSHPGDAISHGIPLILFPAAHPPPPKPTGPQAGMERSKGYAVRA